MVLELKEKPQEEPLKDALKARPMSVLSDKFFRQGVVKVEGVLLEVNEEVLPNLPLKKDKIAKELSLFVDWSGKNAEMDLDGLYHHGRLLSFNVEFGDKYGNAYAYIAVKGPGIPKQSDMAGEMHGPIRKSTQKGVWGLEDYWMAKADWDSSNELLKNGIQTSVPIAIIQLESITLNGEKKTIKELRELGIIPPDIKYDGEVYDYRPVIYLVGFSEIMRIRDATRDNYEQFADEHKMTFQEYAGWWSDRLAMNLAKLHNLGKVHRCLTEHNMTLDGCFVDNDTMRNANESEKKSGNAYLDDIVQVLRNFPVFFAETREDLSKAVDMGKCHADFLRKYFENRKMGEEELKYLREGIETGYITNKEFFTALQDVFGKDFSKGQKID